MKFLLSFVIVLQASSEIFAGLNQVIIGCPVPIAAGSTDSVLVKVYLTNEVPISLFRFAFRTKTPGFTISSAVSGPALTSLDLPGHITCQRFESGRMAEISWCTPNTYHLFPTHTTPTHTFSFWLQPAAGYAGQCVDIDSARYAFNCCFHYYISSSQTWIYPDYIDCETCEVVGLIIACGDADASGQIDVTDAVFLVNYIFAGGPAPRDSAAGDYDCNSQTDITDAVHMINYIFADGPPPCNACP